jgi:DNA-binding NarL/FixJ family response regulator
MSHGKSHVLYLVHSGTTHPQADPDLYRNTEPPQPNWADSAPILIVDGDAEYCAAVAGILRRAGYDSHRVSTGEEAVKSAHSRRPAAVILDVILPGATGYELCRELREEHGEDLPILFASGERTEPADRVVGLLIGGDDYILKPFDPDELIARLRRMIARSSVRHDGAPNGGGISELTSRESEVLRLLAQGLNQGAIAEELGISPATVGTHIQRVLTKLDVHSRTQAVALAYRERLLEQV